MVLEVFRENQLHPYQNSRSAHTFPCFVRFCSTSTTVTCEHQVTFMLFVNMYIMSSSVSRVLVGIVRDIILSFHMPPDGLTAQEYCFLETLPSEFLGCSLTLTLSIPLCEANLNSTRPCSSTMCGSC